MLCIEHLHFFKFSLSIYFPNEKPIPFDLKGVRFSSLVMILNPEGFKTHKSGPYLLTQWSWPTHLLWAQLEMDKLQWTLAKGLNGGNFLMSALAPSINFFLALSFKSKQLKVAGFSVGPDSNLVSSYHSLDACGSTCALTWGALDPHRIGVSRISPIKTRQQRWGYKQGSQNNRLKSNLKAVMFSLLTKLIQILLFLYSLYLWNFSSTTYWLKNKDNQQPSPTPLMKRL